MPLNSHFIWLQQTSMATPLELPLNSSPPWPGQQCLWIELIIKPIAALQTILKEPQQRKKEGGLYFSDIHHRLKCCCCCCNKIVIYWHPGLCVHKNRIENFNNVHLKEIANPPVHRLLSWQVPPFLDRAAAAEKASVHLEQLTSKVLFFWFQLCSFS